MNKSKKPLGRKDCFFGIHLDLHPEPNDTELGADITEEMLADFLDKVKPDHVQYDCKGHPGWSGYPTEVGSPTHGIIKDSLALWRKATAERGIGLYIHYSGVWDSRAIELHPEWARRNENGKTDGKNTSVFGPYVDELLIPQLKEVARKYSLDGVWIDGECWSVAPDYSQMARKTWKEKTGKEKLPKGPEDKDWAEFMDFNRQGFLDYVRHYVEELHSELPDFQIASNWLYTSFVPNPEEVPVDWISGDYSPGSAVDFARLDARYMSSTKQPWDLLAWGFNYGEGFRPIETLKTVVQLQQEAAVVLAQGGGFTIYYLPSRAGWVDPWMTGIMAEVADFCRQRQAFCHKSRTVPQIALLDSSATFYEKSDKAKRLFSSGSGQNVPNYGALYALLALGYSVDVVAEHYIKGRLFDYPVIVLPECTKVPEDFLEELRIYLHEGGSILVIGAETVRFFEEDLAVQFLDSPKERTGQLKFRNGMAGVKGQWQEIELHGAEPVASIHSSTDPRKGNKIAATLNKSRRGRIGAVYGPLATMYRNSGVPILRDLFGKLMKELFPEPKVEISAPPCVDVVLREKNGALLVHLANVTNRQNFEREAIIDHIPPVGPFNIKIRLDEPPSLISMEPEGKKLDFEWDDGVANVEVPGLDIYSILRIS